MAMLPYQTKITQLHSVDKLSMALRREMIEYPFPALSSLKGRVIKHAFMVTPRPEHEDVPVLTQYLDLEGKNAPNLIFDARAYMRWDQRSDSYHLTAENDYVFQCNRIVLNLIAMRDGMNALNRFGPVPAKIFTRWISLTLSSRFNLAPEHQINLLVLTAFYYLALVDRELVATAEDRVKMVNNVVTVTGIPAPTVLAISDRIGDDMPDTAEGFADLINKHSGSLRFGTFKYNDLFNMLAPTWIGVHGRETVGVALEHIPTFLAMILASINERSFRKARFVERVKTDARPAEQQQFSQTVGRLIFDYLDA